MDQSLLDRYIAGAEVPAQAIAGLSKTDLLVKPVPGTWSIQQIVLHLLDSDLIASDRMKRVAAEDRPTLIGYNETLFANTLYFDDLDAGLACDLLAKNRRLTFEILKRLPDEAFARTGLHNESGEITLEYLVKTYVQHLDHHLKFIRKKRAMLGKPLAE
jgi:DinB superfamily